MFVRVESIGGLITNVSVFRDFTDATKIEENFNPEADDIRVFELGSKMLKQILEGSEVEISLTECWSHPNEFDAD
ncbi:MAG: hypothetical protein D6732_05250 [Methanobacteriota archaeon]|nr:MAG: hypothetical protein D6732_05250 [Euryarchaeota archaeon]